MYNQNYLNCRRTLRRWQRGRATIVEARMQVTRSPTWAARFRQRKHIWANHLISKSRTTPMAQENNSSFADGLNHHTLFQRILTTSDSQHVQNMTKTSNLFQSKQLTSAPYLGAHHHHLRGSDVLGDLKGDFFQEMWLVDD